MIKSLGGRPLREYRTVSKIVYNKFCELHPEVELDYSEWEKIIKTYNGMLRDYIVTSGEKVKLPRGLGSLVITGKKSHKINKVGDREFVNLSIDWNKSKKVGKKIYHFNNHTDGYRYRWMWFQGDSRFYLSDIWMFKPCRKASRAITAFIKTNPPGRIEVYKQWTRK